MYAHAIPGPHGAGQHHHGCHGRKWEGRSQGPDLGWILRAMAGGGPRGGGRGGPWGRGGFGGPGFGPGPGFGRGGRRARRGDVRAALLVLLAEEPRNGYQLMQEIEERSNGAWRPSPGSVYPALQQLQDEGLVRVVEDGERRAFELTDAGRAHVEERRATLGTPWEQPGDEDAGELRSLMMGVGAALFQVMQSGTDSQRAEAQKILADARRSLYRLLADDDEDDTDPAA